MRNEVDSITDERLIELVGIHEGVNTAIAKATGLHVRTIQRRRAALAHKGHAPQQGLHEVYPDGFHLGKVTIQRNAEGTVERTWERMCADDQHRLELQRAAMEAMLSDLPRITPRVLKGSVRDDLLTVYPIGDPHIGMYAWGEETGDDWDLNLAEQVHCDAMHLLVDAAPKSKRALVVNLGDLFHYDSLEAKTPRSGHFLDADGRYAKMIQVGVKVMRRCIASALLKHQEVHVINVPGNHDETGALWLATALNIAYENEPRVIVDMGPSLFAYHRFGKVLLGTHHGHTCKAEKLPGVMAADRAKDWGETVHRHWLTGHIHHEMRKEYPGCTVESFNTLAAKDAYAMNGGWRSGRSLSAIVYHKDFGEVARSKVNAAMVEKA